jgi:hypothetical protein
MSPQLAQHEMWPGHRTGTLSLAAPDVASDVEQRWILLREPALREKEGDREAILRCWAFSRVQSSAVQSQLDRTKQKTLD